MIRPMKLVYFSEEYTNINHMMNQMIIDGFNPEQIEVYLSHMYDFPEKTIKNIISGNEIVDRFNKRNESEVKLECKDTNLITFKYESDRLYFLNLFDRLEDETYKIAPYFDFRPPVQKRKEFNHIKNKIFQQLINENGLKCMLNLSPKCTIESGISIDHIISLSTNILNKELRHIKSTEKGRKVQSIKPL